MSGNYYKVTPEPEKPEVYGFKKVGKSEISLIVSRLTKPTYNSRVQSQEPHKIHNYVHLHSTLPPRTPSSCNKVHDYQFGHEQDKRRFTERELQRLLRRIQKPTRANILSRNSYRSTDPNISSAGLTTAWRPESGNQLEKVVKHLSRPTTASKGKHALECYLCLDDERELNKTLVPFEYMYANDRSATSEEVKSIVSRLSSSTRASDRGFAVCCRLSPDYNSLHVQSERLPLVSGLARTKSVAEIVNRLHSSQGSRIKRYHGYSAMETQVTNY